jgi:PAS domain S-box-containing protein
VVSTLDPGRVLDRILEQVELLLNVKMSAIVALDESAGVFRARASRGLTDSYVEKIAISPNEYSSVTMRAIKVGVPIQVSDTETDPSYGPFRQRARSGGFRAVISIPLNTVHAPPSALVIYHTTPKEFSRREITLLTSFANHAAMAIENAELYARSDARLQDQTRRLEALIQSLDVGLVLENLDGDVIYANRAFSEVIGIPVSEIIGESVEELMNVFLELVGGNENELRTAFERLVNSDADQVVEFNLDIRGGKRFFRVKNFMVSDPSDALIGRGQIIRDITRDHELDRMKSSLISTVSHELRTPLAAIKGYATTLLADDVDWELIAQKEFLEIISQEADRLSELVNDLLDMSRIEAGNLTLSQEISDIQDIIHNSVRRVYPNPSNRLKIELSNDLPKVFVDPHRLEAVFRNLIENAVKYSGETSTITITARITDHLLEIRVSDDGLGIPLEQQDRLFESFIRIENENTHGISGAGLGLAICRGFIHAHGGKIWLEPVDEGTCVAFTLPIGIPESHIN